MRTRLREIWYGMRKRCNNPRYKEFYLYGGKGVKICNEWDTFENFKTWALNNGYNASLSIDRIDSNGDYEPNNCRWATPIQQSRNTSRNVWITYNGETKCLSDWSKILNIPRKVLKYRIDKGWDMDKVFNTPVSAVFKPLLVGDKYNRLTVIGQCNKHNTNIGLRYLCRCDCGKYIEVIGSHLRNGYVKSCGCLQKEWITQYNKSKIKK